MISSTTTIQHRYSKPDRFVFWLSRHWVFVISIILGIYALIPFFAPFFMALGLTIPAKIIYWIYSYLCHQLPERSYFLFGPNISYSLPQIKQAWQNTIDIVILRQFIGNAQMGWKVAWSDRMVSMFTSLWIFGMVWGLFRKRMSPLPWWGLVLFLLPMAVDGTTHLVSDFAGIGQGFRDTNAWLAALTQQQLPASFYAGDAWGSFNAWMRFASGICFGIGIVWFGFPHLDIVFANSAEVVEYKYQYQSWLVREKERLAQMASSGKSAHYLGSNMMNNGAGTTLAPAPREGEGNFNGKSGSGYGMMGRGSNNYQNGSKP